MSIAKPAYSSSSPLNKHAKQQKAFVHRPAYFHRVTFLLQYPASESFLFSSVKRSAGKVLERGIVACLFRDKHGRQELCIIHVS
jgi:hypothetical protein